MKIVSNYNFNQVLVKHAGKEYIRELDYFIENDVRSDNICWLVLKKRTKKKEEWQELDIMNCTPEFLDKLEELYQKALNKEYEYKRKDKTVL